MKTIAQTLELKDEPGVIERYEAYHRRAWPEVFAALRDAGVREMRIYRLGRTLFMTFDAPDDFDPARDFARFQSDPRLVEWERTMRAMQRPAPGARPGEWWAPMALVFDQRWGGERD